MATNHASKLHKLPSRLQMALSGHLDSKNNNKNNNKKNNLDINANLGGNWNAKDSPSRLEQSAAHDFAGHGANYPRYPCDSNSNAAGSPQLHLGTNQFAPTNNQNERGCYVCKEVTVEEVNDVESKVRVSGLVHFFWIQDAIYPDSHELIIDASTAEPIRGAELLFQLQESAGITIQSKMANRVVVLDPINDERLAMPVLSRRTKPLALFKGLDGNVSVDRVLFYPDCGLMHLSYRYTGWLTQSMPTWRFPFDRQAIKLELLTRDCPPASIFDPVGDGRTTRVVATPPPSILASYAYLLDETQFRLISPADVRVGPGLADTWELGPDPRVLACLDYSRQSLCPLPTLVVPLQRRTLGLFTRILLPSWLIVVMGSASFALDEDKLFQRIALVSVNLACLLLLRFGISGALPKIKTLTLLDYYFVFGYLMLLLMAVLNIAAVTSATDEDGSRFTDLSSWSVLIVPWTLFHIAMYVLRNSGFLRGDWNVVVTRAKLNRMMPTEGNRVFPMKTTVRPEDLMRPHNFEPVWWNNDGAVQPTQGNAALYNPQLPTQWSQSNNDRIIERLAAGGGVNTQLDVKNRPSWQIGGGVGYRNGGGGGGGGSPVYRGALLTAANAREMDAVRAGGLGISSPQHRDDKILAANILEQVANDHQRRGSPRGKGGQLSPLGSPRSKRSNRNKLSVSTASVSPLRRAMSQRN